VHPLKPSPVRRVLFLAPYLGDGGINSHMLTLGTDLRKAGLEVAICSGGAHVGETRFDITSEGSRVTRAPIPEDYERAGIHHFDVSIPASPHRLAEVPRLLLIPVATWQVVRAVRRFRPDVVHSHSRQMGLYARVAQLLLGVPFVSSVHSPITPRNRIWAATTFLGVRVLAVSDEIRAGMIRDYHVAPERVRMVPPGPDAQHFRPAGAEERRAARQRWGVGEEQFVLAFVGSLTENKHPETLVEAVADLVHHGRDVVALVAGRGPVEDEVAALSGRRGVSDRVRLLGYQESRSVLWAADALVLPSRSEGTPLVVSEAMLSGVVVASTPVGGAVRQLASGQTGVLFEHGDHRELAERVAQLIDDPDQRQELVARALEEARAHYSATAMVEAVIATYEDALRERRA
jgi:glycosyltransferase involved in cell wall biosynthesis